MVFHPQDAEEVKVWTLSLGERAMSARITAEDAFNEVSKMIREERGIKRSVGVAAN
ncbi:hypothetical protein [Limnoglobus roseus]|uniref:Uncharacterized protein n=1 Tax=Limnoglobus roseus TaxID=2598579 RepID=A0A5C1ABA7_9BACT|nr:hypothetical protein [Limnoglobus roseus]QEL16659.1 hypothetical protein PX52LOC_03620 [Limnoglobus roseus]